MGKAIVSSGSRRLVGDVWTITTENGRVMAFEPAEAKGGPTPGSVAIVKGAFELWFNGTETVAIPVDAEDGPVDICAKIDSIRWYDDMPDGGLKYDELLFDCQEFITKKKIERESPQSTKTLPRQQKKPMTHIR